MKNNKNISDVDECSQLLNLEAYQYILSQLDAPVDNNIHMNCWRIDDLTVNFDIIVQLEKNYPLWIKSIGFNVVSFSKIIFLKSVEGLKSRGVIHYRFYSLMKVFVFLARNNKIHLVQGDVQDYFEFQLIHSIHNNRVVKRLNPLCYHNFKCGITIHDWVNIRKINKLPQLGFDQKYSESFMSKTLKKTFERISGESLTYRDWVEGGSFNNLTLDFGRYYVEHCVSFFEEHIHLAIALKATLNEAAAITRKAGLFVNKTNLRSYVMLVIGNFLIGRKASDLTARTQAKHSKIWFDAIEKVALKTLKKHIKILKVLDELTKTESIKDVAKKMNIEPLSDDQLQSMKFLVQARWFFLAKKQVCLNPSIIKLKEIEENLLCKHLSVNLNSLRKEIDKRFRDIKRNQAIVMPSTRFFKSIDIVEKSTQSTFINNFLRLVESAGTIKFVAFTGWRESEYGFSIEDLYTFENKDIIDKEASPLRFEVKWTVPKTSGASKLRREVNRSSYETALYLSQLTSVRESATVNPVLYSYNTFAKCPSQSGSFIKRTVGGLWSHFKFNYKPFQQLNLLAELNLINAKSTLNPSEVSRKYFLTKLSDEEGWVKLENDALLISVYKRVNEEYERVSFFLNSDQRRGVVSAYRDGLLDPKQKNLLDTYLSQSTKEAIQRLAPNEEPPPIVTKEVINEVISGCLYPTPHAFRHMWAEAVYRRFDGDAGWMIRSNFKHISQTMWLSYIRNKDSRRQHDKVKKRVVSSLLHSFLLNKGVGYAGNTEIVLRRMFLSTKVVSVEEISSSLNEFIDVEIKDIKSNPWGYCILRTRSQGRAKCASGGVPQRHNASPSMCLGCTHSLTQLGNVEGILLGVSNDLKTIQNERVPMSFRITSFNTVRNALKHLKKLSANEEITDEIEKVLNLARKSL